MPLSFPCFCRIRFCLMIYRTLGLPLFLLLFFEPLSIAFETLQVNFLEIFRMMVSICVLIGLSVDLLIIIFYISSFGVWKLLQAILVHGFQLLDIWLHHSAENCSNCQISKFFNMTIAGIIFLSQIAFD